MHTEKRFTLAKMTPDPDSESRQSKSCRSGQGIACSQAPKVACHPPKLVHFRSIQVGECRDPTVGSESRARNFRVICKRHNSSYTMIEIHKGCVLSRGLVTIDSKSSKHVMFFHDEMSRLACLPGCGIIRGTRVKRVRKNDILKCPRYLFSSSALSFSHNEKRQGGISSVPRLLR